MIYAHDPKKAAEQGLPFCPGTSAFHDEEKGTVVCNLCGQDRTSEHLKRAQSPLRRPQYRAQLSVIKERNPEAYQALIDGLKYIRSLFPVEWHDKIRIEICGSTAFDFAHPRSDIDVNFGVDNWRYLRQIEYLRRVIPNFRQEVNNLEDRLGVRFQITARTISAKSIEKYPKVLKELKTEYGDTTVDNIIEKLGEYIQVPPVEKFRKYPVYSVDEEKFYNKKPHEVFPHTLTWNLPTDWYEVKPPKVPTPPRPVKFVDPFEGEIEEARKIYGKDYMELDEHGFYHRPEV